MIFFEPKRRYWEKAEVDTDADPGRRCTRPGVVRAGTDVTLLAYGPMVKTCLEAATAAAEEEGASLEVIDLRSMSPLDIDAGLDVGARRPAGWSSCTRRRSTCGSGAEIAARITERCFYYLEAPVLRVGGFDTPYPPARLEESTCPTWTGCSTPSTASLALLREA